LRAYLADVLSAMVYIKKMSLPITAQIVGLCYGFGNYSLILLIMTFGIQIYPLQCWFWFKFDWGNLKL